jgi:nicotinamidase-related amidase
MVDDFDRIEIELDWEAAAVAVENQLPNTRSYLDLDTGSVHTINNDEHLERSRIVHSGRRLLPVQPRPSRDGYRTMQSFIEKIDDNWLRDRLQSALIGKGAFRRFKDLLLDYPDIRQKWFAYKDAAVYEYIRSWLETNRITPRNEPPQATYSEDEFATLGDRNESKRDLKQAMSSEEVDTEWREVVAPYDRPELSFRPERAALLIMDMQNVFVHPSGTSFLPMSVGIVDYLAHLVECCRQRGVPVIFTRHAHQDPELDGGGMKRWWNSLILEGTDAAKLHERFQPKEDERVINKCRYSAFTSTPLEMLLNSRGVQDIIVGGVMTNLCCETTARDAFVKDFNVFFLGDGTATTNFDLHHATLRNIAYGFGKVLGISDVIQRLQI